MLTNNNVSIRIANSLSSNFGFVKEKNRNVFIIDGVKFCFSVSWGNRAECRQFYDDCGGVMVLNMNDNTIYKFFPNERRWELSSNRDMPNTIGKVSARSYIESYSNGTAYATLDFDSESRVIEFVEVGCNY